MSKICDRDYQANQAYTQKMIDGVGCCPLCEKPAICHGKPIYDRALFWAMSGDTGISSEAICNHMLGYPERRVMPPSDASDRGRCIRLLELVPEWIPRLNEMLKYDSKKNTDTFVISSSGISADQNTWSKQIPLIIQEGKL